MRAKRVHLVRHASVEGRFVGRYLGRTDVALSAEGVREARELGGIVAAGEVWSSPLSRCRRTACEAGFVAARAVPELQEVDFGDWEGRSFDEIARAHPALVEQWSRFDPGFRFPAGESLGEFVGRMERVRSMIAGSEAREIVCFTHGGVITTLICLFLGIQPDRYLAFQVERAGVATLSVFQNGLGRLLALRPGSGAEEWPS